LVLAILSGKSVKITRIRHNDKNPGLREFEGSLLRLIDMITNGTKIEISETGTALYFQPGLLSGGKIEMDCNPERGLGYYLEALICLAPFCKQPLEAKLTGVTNDQNDPSVDSIKLGTIPILKQFLGTDEGLGFDIKSRGVKPEGGGKVIFRCPTRRQLRPMQIVKEGKIKRIRGIAYTIFVSPSIANRMVETAKGRLLQYIPDVYIVTDHTGQRKYSGSGKKSPGFGICLVAETTSGTVFTAEVTSNPANSGKTPSVPEDLGTEGAHLLLEEIYRGGCVDSSSQSLTALFMALGPKDVSKTLTGPLSPYTIEFLRHIRDFFSLVFKLEATSHEEDEKLNVGAKKVLLTCLGLGYTNLSKPNA